eukprot:TRINITY_DN23591_c0_g2_i7.p2 TRINITY_DN23591_c0_g2~~TRINITY_DN23591_c0_g2_i7.p2  ORF type:complete len:787 (-),score=108.54 TRINITY_DN23591_c0_g2_i7:159-2519(-)
MSFEKQSLKKAFKAARLHGRTLLKLRVATAGVHGVLSNKSRVAAETLRKHVWNRNGWVAYDQPNKTLDEMFESKVSQEMARDAFREFFKPWNFFGRVLVAFRASHPLVKVSYFCLEMSSLKRAKLESDMLVGGVAISALFFSASGSAISMRSPQDCADQRASALRFVSIGFCSTMFVSIPVSMARALFRRTLIDKQQLVDNVWRRETIQDFTHNAAFKKQRRWWKFLDIVFWVTGSVYSFFCFLIITIFSANLHAADHWKWVLTCLFLLLRLLFLQPFAFSLLLAAAAELVRSQDPEFAKRGDPCLGLDIQVDEGADDAREIVGSDGVRQDIEGGSEERDCADGIRSDRSTGSKPAGVNHRGWKVMKTLLGIRRWRRCEDHRYQRGQMGDHEELVPVVQVPPPPCEPPLLRVPPALPPLLLSPPPPPPASGPCTPLPLGEPELSLAQVQPYSTAAVTAESARVRKVDELSFRSMSIKDLIHFWGEMGSGRQYMPHYEAETSTSHDVVRQVIIPLSGAHDPPSSYATMVAKGQQRLPDVMVTHNWGNVYSHLFAAIISHCGFQETYDSMARLLAGNKLGSLGLSREQWEMSYWICCFCVNQHTVMCNDAPPKDSHGKPINACPCDVHKLTSGDACEVDKFDDMMSNLAVLKPRFSQLVAVDLNFVIFMRAWCVAEIAEAKRLEIHQALVIHSKEHTKIHALCRKKAENFDVAKCEASNPSDKQRIMNRIKDRDHFNAHVRNLLFNDNGLLASALDTDVCCLNGYRRGSSMSSVVWGEALPDFPGSIM